MSGLLLYVICTAVIAPPPLFFVKWHQVIFSKWCFDVHVTSWLFTQKKPKIFTIILSAPNLKSWICPWCMPEEEMSGCSGSDRIVSWIYNYLCYQCISPVKLWVRIPLMTRCTRYVINHHVIKFVSDLCRCDSLVIFSINKTYRHDITQILLKVVLKQPTPPPLFF